MKDEQVGIVGYGAYLPRYKRLTETIPGFKERGSQLGIRAKSVANWDEDSVTMGVTAGMEAVRMAGAELNEMGAVYMGSESHPYAVNPSSTIVGDALGLPFGYMAADLQFACKAAAAGMQMVASHVTAGAITYGLVIGADKAQARAGDVLEYSVGAGAGALVVGRKNLVAVLEGFVSVSSDTPDFWRRAGEEFPRHGGRFSGEPAYFRHVTESTRRLLRQWNRQPEDYDHVVFHMPNGKFPVEVGRRLGFGQRQLALGFIVEQIGNPYSASALLGLCAIFDQAKANERILVTTYGSGAGADSFSLVTTEELVKKRRGRKKLRRLWEQQQEINYQE